MIILDSNVVSEVMRPEPNEKVIAWLNRQLRSSVWTTSVTVFEIRFELQSMPAGKRRDVFSEGFDTLLHRIDQRVAPFDHEAAEHASTLMAFRRLQGRPRDDRDTMIAGIVLSLHATLATRDVSHFDDLSAPVVNPWTA
jgi:toxin FitB